MAGALGNYRAIVHYRFKPGMEQKAIEFIKNELFKQAEKDGCKDIEILADERHEGHWVGTGVWNSIDEARNFQSHWNVKEKELQKYCTEAPKREIYRIERISGKVRKAA
jgi:hypothetical protein